MIVLKFGGSSLASAEKISRIRELLVKRAAEEDRIAIIVSALGESTDKLLELGSLATKGVDAYGKELDVFRSFHQTIIDELFPSDIAKSVSAELTTLVDDLNGVLHGVGLVHELSPRTRDFVMSFGERIAALIVSHALKAEFPDAEFLDARNLIRTDREFGGAHVDFDVSFEAIRKHFQEHTGLQVITGFTGATSENETTTLGRGGSDYTAALFAVALGASRIEIWTDVDGVMSADPRKVEKAFSIERLSYEEAMELSHFGARVVYPPSIQPAFRAGIPVYVRNSFHPEFPGTLISAEKADSVLPITGITSIDMVSLLRVEGSGMVGVTGVSRRLFSALATRDINVLLISQASSEHSICFAVDPEDSEQACSAVRAEFKLEIRDGLIEDVSVDNETSVIAIVGENMRRAPGIAGKFFQALGQNGINIIAIAQGSSELNISAVIPRTDVRKALNAVHGAFFRSERKTINLFQIGIGQVGAKLLEQIDSHLETFRRDQNIDVRVVAVANSRKMHFERKGTNLTEWKSVLEKEGKPFSLNAFVSQMKELNLSNSIFVDCSASEDVSKEYEGILAESISIVTPNKRANSGPYERYQQLQQTALRSNVKFYYETTVGAGLPVLSTLGDLLASGDEIVRIEAVLSGTLSYIFNSFTEGKVFSDVVREAKESGYTEPDPRDDLSGMDVARKLLILGREMGLPLSENDVEVESLIPGDCGSAPSVEEFLSCLEKHDAEFTKRQQDALECDRKLCYIGKLENGKGEVSLQAVDAEHPFSSLSGSDNIISFTTKRYFERQLVVKGPGAGTDVTAAGVLADIVKVTSYLG